MTNSIKKIRSNKDGGTMAVFAVALPVMIGAVAMSVEAGFWMKSKTDVQMVADMAAFAGAKELESNTNAKAILMAKLSALDNAYDFESGQITVNSPPTSGAYAGESAVEVILVQQGLKFFSGVISDEAIQYRVRAVAAVMASAEVCALSLSESASSAFWATGNTDINFDGCSIGSNSDANNAVRLQGSMTAIADCLYSGGGIVGGDKATTQCPNQQSNAPQIDDPFEGLAAPEFDEDDDDDDEWPCLDPINAGGNDRDLDPGRYCDDMTIRGTYDLDPGVYVFDGIRVRFQGGELQGTGVSIILMNGARITNMNGNDQINISAMTTGDYKGIAIFSDPDTQPDNGEFRFTGSSASSIEGALYFPNQEIEFGGNTAGASDCTLIIADRIKMTGGSTLESSGCQSAFGIGSPSVNGTFIVE